ncbi:exonuclease DPD1, chloroplastic/mitochondrial-like [Oryza glaberrima]|uniref:Exonuclease domain-containing protein n=1 Tax=Oryza glaberrima TaxID=4538 RepID=I1PQ14_ORYGL|nr:exonuclease DPD1, chloroplastic/mitochondrial-like [Oryza glaberrima]XP_052154330.1 exonuclease DPD1, chloroplastic/mitochondrial-like [Oryza glaberrima]
MSSILRSIQLRNSIWSSFPVRFLKQQAGLSTVELLDPRSCGKRHFTTQVQEHGKEVAAAATILVFDLETTGYFHKDHRIVEFALCDLSGGKNSTFETLVNPERTVPNYVEHLIKIGTDLVCRPGIPRFSDVIPLLLAFVRSRQAPGKPVLWVAHNAKQFDARFLAQEFDRCSAPLPADWLFFDTLLLAKKMVKAEGKKRRTSLEALREHYGIVSHDDAHRAMRDVMILSQVFQKMTFDLKVTNEELINEAMKLPFHVFCDSVCLLFLWTSFEQQSEPEREEI